MVKKKEEVKTAPVLEKVEEVVEEVFPNNGVVVTNHLDRRDSGTNWNESPSLPSLDD